MDSYPTERHHDIPLFVGRRSQVAWCEAWLHEACAGRPRIVLLSGEAGVGKTRLLTEIQRRAQQYNMRVYAGRCAEDRAWPDLPFVKMLLTDVVQGIQELSPALHSAVEVMRRFLEQETSPQAMPQASAADQDKLQLFLAVSCATILLAQNRPCLLAVDDLHWADPPLLDFLRHLVFSVADATMHETVPLCIMATYRPEETTERLDRLLGRFYQEASCARLEIGGLEESDVYELLENLEVRRPSHQLVATVKTATRGNPQFIQEMIYSLRLQGALRERGGATVTTAFGVDVGLFGYRHGALLARIQTLGAPAQQILTNAACLGDRFSLQLLSAVSDMAGESLLDILEEGIRQHVLLSDGADFQFAHPVLRQAFLSPLSLDQRQRWHHRIAQVIEVLYADHLDTHLGDLAHHLIAAGPIVAPHKVVTYARWAGDQAFARFAWSAATHYYEAALDVAAKAPHGAVYEQAYLHYRAGYASYCHQDMGPCFDHYNKAIAVYQGLDNVMGVAQVLLAKTRARCTFATVLSAAAVDIQPLEDVLQAVGERNPRLTGEMATVLAEAYWMTKQTEQARVRGEQALRLGQSLADEALCCRASVALGMAQGQAMALRDCLQSWQQSLVYAQRAKVRWLQVSPLSRLPLMLTVLGSLDTAESLAHQACVLAQQTQTWTYYSLALSHLTALAAARGDHEAVTQYHQETMRMVSRSDYLWGGSRSLLACAGSQAARGEWDAAAATLATLVQPGKVFPQPGGTMPVSVRVLRQLLRAYASLPSDDNLSLLVAEVQGLAGNDTYTLALHCALVELADFLVLLELPQFSVQVLTLAGERGALFSSGWMFLLPRILGIAATCQGLWEQAETYFHTAISVARRERAQPELGRTYLDYAHMLVARHRSGEPARAVALAQQAQAIFQDYHMPPCRERAARFLASWQEHRPQGLPGTLQEDRWLRVARQRTRFVG